MSEMGRLYHTPFSVFESGNPLEKRRCPIDGKKVKACIKCATCAIMNGFGGAGAFSDGKYNITNDFGGTLYEYIGKKQALELMQAEAAPIWTGSHMSSSPILMSACVPFPRGKTPTSAALPWAGSWPFSQ